MIHIQSHCNLKIPPKSCNRGRRNSRRIYRTSLVCHYSHMLLGNVTEICTQLSIKSLHFETITWQSNDLQRHYTFQAILSNWEGNVPSIHGIVQCVCQAITLANIDPYLGLEKHMNCLMALGQQGKDCVWICKISHRMEQSLQSNF